MDRMVTLHTNGHDFDPTHGEALARALAALERALRSYSPGRDRRAATLIAVDVLLDEFIDADQAAE
jgi:hypothetical protein